MAKPAETLLSPTPIPQPYPQRETDNLGFSLRTGFKAPGPTLPDDRGNLGFTTLKPMDTFAEHPDPFYKPFVITRR